MITKNAYPEAGVGEAHLGVAGAHPPMVLLVIHREKKKAPQLSR